MATSDLLYNEERLDVLVSNATSESNDSTEQEVSSKLSRLNSLLETNKASLESMSINNRSAYKTIQRLESELESYKSRVAELKSKLNVSTSINREISEELMQVKEDKLALESKTFSLQVDLLTLERKVEDKDIALQQQIDQIEQLEEKCLSYSERDQHQEESLVVSDLKNDENANCPDNVDVKSQFKYTRINAVIQAIHGMALPNNSKIFQFLRTLRDKKNNLSSKIVKSTSKREKYWDKVAEQHRIVSKASRSDH